MAQRGGAGFYARSTMESIVRILKKQSPGRLIALGFAAVILIGAGLLLLPVSVKPGATVTPIDALFTSTSAVCVTGLIAIDTADHFTFFGQAVVAGLIQIGGFLPLQHARKNDGYLRTADGAVRLIDQRTIRAITSLYNPGLIE